MRRLHRRFILLILALLPIVSACDLGALPVATPIPLEPTPTVRTISKPKNLDQSPEVADLLPKRPATVGSAR